MGMSASQVRLLQLTSRKNDIGRELSTLSNQKMSLTRDMQKVSKEYNSALNSKVLKWSNNGGVNYIDLSYDNLMRPGVMNQNKAYLLTDNNGKIVLDSAYKKYAEIISPDGSSCNNWTGQTRLDILSKISGVSIDKISNYENCQQNVWDAKETLDAIGNPPVNTAEKNTTVENLLKQLGDSTLGATFDNHKNWAEAYRSHNNGTITVNGESEFKTIMTNLGNELGKYLPDSNEKGSLIKQACDSVYDAENRWFNSNSDIDSFLITKKDGNKLTFNVAALIDQVLGAYTSIGGKHGDNTITWVEPGSKYNEYLNKKQEYDNKKNAATEQYNAACLARGQALTSEEEKLIKFYDSLFSAIAEKGWTYNESVKDTEYLNQMLQNNSYTLTTLNREEEVDDETGDYFYSNNYFTDIATNMNNIFTVNDSQVRSDALVEYEHKKSIISAKESRIDLRMQDLQTEQSAVSQMIQSIEKQMNDNIERTMNIFSG